MNFKFAKLPLVANCQILFEDYFNKKQSTSKLPNHNISGKPHKNVQQSCTLIRTRYIIWVTTKIRIKNEKIKKYEIV